MASRLLHVLGTSFLLLLASLVALGALPPPHVDSSFALQVNPPVTFTEKDLVTHFPSFSGTHIPVMVNSKIRAKWDTCFHKYVEEIRDQQQQSMDTDAINVRQDKDDDDHHEHEHDRDHDDDHDHDHDDDHDHDHDDDHDHDHDHQHQHNTVRYRIRNEVMSDSLKVLEESCFVLNEYSDHLPFMFQYQAPEEGEPEFNFEEPNIYTNQPHHASVYNYEYNEDQMEGSFDVFLDCANRKKPATTLVVLDFTVNHYFVLKFAFVKKCGYGLHDKIQFGYYKGTMTNYGIAWLSKPEIIDHTKFKLTKATTKDTRAIYTEHPSSPHTELFVALQPGADMQTFGDPEIILEDLDSSKPTSKSPFGTSTENLEVMIRGGFHGGILYYNRPIGMRAHLSLGVFYTCKGTAETLITMYVPIPPFEPLVGQWIKSCNRSANIVTKTNFVISTVPAYDTLIPIYDNGDIHSNFKLPRSSLASKAPIDVHVYDTTAAYADFTFRSKSNKPIFIEKIVISVSDEEILDAFIVIPEGFDGSSFISEERAVVDTVEKTLRIKFLCMHKGESNVLIDVMIRNRTPIEFGFVKQCTNPKVHKRASHLSLAHVITLCFIGALAAIVYGFLSIIKSTGSDATSKAMKSAASTQASLMTYKPMRSQLHNIEDVEMQAPLSLSIPSSAVPLNASAPLTIAPTATTTAIHNSGSKKE